MWNGRTGTLIAKLKANAAKIQVCSDSLRLDVMSMSATRSALPVCQMSQMTPSIIKRLPATVYRKNLVVAYKRRSPPQMPRMK